MSTALAMGSRGLGTTAPNPSVGCIIVIEGRVIGRGWTQPGGRPHAETEALAQAGEGARGATAYVTLEPCCHQGDTPPCTDALIAAGIARVVIGSTDPDKRINGKGIAALKDSGIEVVTGVMRELTDEMNCGYFKRTNYGLPHVALKIAMTMDGNIALANGISHWITGADARRYGHFLRATYDAVLVGSGTVISDNPELTCRLPGIELDLKNQPVRIVLDRRLRIRYDSKLVSTASSTPTWVVTAENANKDKVAQLEHAGVGVLIAETTSDEKFSHAAASILAQRGMTRILIEGGAKIAAAFLRADLIDRIYAFRASSFVGGDGIPAVSGLNLNSLTDSLRFNRVNVRELGADLVEILERKASF
ncbi:MAG: bifunctional diaminohydroxyphosphoribosylaminopyrimidine deaminase/5-amino-6-(5-phosphoribosylamino)uracil reductase RibD [Rhodospirillaceae bacterium]